MHSHATSDTISRVAMSLYRGGIRSVAWWVTAGQGVAVLALNLDGQIELGAADGSTVFYLAWMAIWTAVGLFVWAARPELRLTGPLWAWSGVLHLNENLLGRDARLPLRGHRGAVAARPRRDRPVALDVGVPIGAGLPPARASYSSRSSTSGTFL